MSPSRVRHRTALEDPAREKDPDKVRAGLASARVRWGTQPRNVSLAELTDDQRRLVMALVEAARSNPTESA